MIKFKDTKYGDLTGKNFGYEVKVNSNKLDSLIGAPLNVKGNFDCSFNNLISLKGRPNIVEDSFYCQHNNLKTLEGSPEKINGNFVCFKNKLVSLEGRPKEIKGNFVCNDNKELKDIKEQIIKYGIKAKKYLTDEGIFYFKEISKDFNAFNKPLKKLKKNNEKLKNEIRNRVKN